MSNEHLALAELTGFGANPGALKSWLFLPSIMAPKTSLVVVLHGCTQTAQGYDRGSGWSQLAERNGFAVLYPEQQRANNPNLCFNWFEPGDTQRGSGEAKSIGEMIVHAVQSHGLDPERVFITGLSAGGAMANVMLATYPELFGAGAIIGGLPFGVASGVGQAFERMQGRNAPSSTTLKSALSTAARHPAHWPKVSIWHGTHDQTVRPVNAEQIAEQWRGVHGSSHLPDRTETINGHTRRLWMNESGSDVVEIYTVKGMAHGVPLASGSDAALGQPGAFMLDASISSTARIARTWGLADDNDVFEAEQVSSSSVKPETMPYDLEAIMAKAMGSIPEGLRGSNHPSGQSSKVAKVINDALRAAGLMR